MGTAALVGLRIYGVQNWELGKGGGVCKLGDVVDEHRRYFHGDERSFAGTRPPLAAAYLHDTAGVAT